MSDIVDRLRWWGAKKRAPKNMPTLPADCADAADEIERLRVDLQAKELKSLGYLRAVGLMQARIDTSIGAMERAITALSDWAVTYAPDMCSDETVVKAKRRIREGGSTLAYIAGAIDMLHAALNAGSGE